jgi:glycosidase
VSDGGHVWWEDAVVYEVYPRSFADADGDGVGDLPGLRSRLGYLADLGVDAIWLTPFYPSPLADGGYDVSDYCAVDPLLGTMADFDALVSGAAARQIRVIIDLVPNHCSSAHPLFRAALAAAPGSDERARFIFRDGLENERGPGGELPPNNWPSQFGGPAWTRVTEADGHHQGPGQWYLHLYDTSQPDWNWHHPDVPALFEDVIRFWLDRGVAGLRVDVAHGIVKDPGLPDLTGPQPLNAPSAYRHRPELQPLFRSWRAILDSYPAEGFPGPRTAVGEVWYDVPETLAPYLEPGGLPQVFNFQLILAGWRAAEFRTAIDSALAMTGGSRAPWVIGNHDVARPASRYRLDEGFIPQTVSRLPRAPALVRRWYRLWFQPNEPGFSPGRTVAAPACGLGPVQRGVPTRRRALHREPVPFGAAAAPRPPRPRPGRPGPGCTALARPGRGRPALLRPGARVRPRGQRRPGAGTAAHRDVLLASGPVAGGSLPPDTAVWLAT